MFQGIHNYGILYKIYCFIAPVSFWTIEYVVKSSNILTLLHVHLCHKIFDKPI